MRASFIAVSSVISSYRTVLAV